MGHKFAQIAFTDTVREIQSVEGSRNGYAAMDKGADYNGVIGPREAGFIALRDSFYMASISETGWPYVQHRGGPVGFLKVIDEQTLGFADFSGNRQYVSVGNFRKNNRVALFLMDYPNRRRLKILGRVAVVNPEDSGLQAQLPVDGYQARVERGVLIHVEAFDWNCSQHITPRYTEAEVDKLIAPILKENRDLKERSPASNRIRELGEGPMELVITGVRQLTPHVRAYELRDLNGADLPAVQAGAHLKVPVQLENGEDVTRHYSICSNPARRDAYEIAVLRDEKGAGGSRAVHNLFKLGLTLHCVLPENNFSLHDDARPAVLIAGGIGITPIKPMAQALQSRGNDLKIHYAGRSDAEMAFRDRLVREFGDAIRIYRSSENERMDLQSILQSSPADAVFYVCGPGRLVESVSKVAEALNIESNRIVTERFSAVIPVDAKPVLVNLKRSGKQLKVAADQTILDAVLEAGVEIPFSCRTGDCKSCAVKVLEGEPDHQDSALTDAERSDAQLMCPCVSRAKSEHLVLDV